MLLTQNKLTNIKHKYGECYLPEIKERLPKYEIKNTYNSINELLKNAIVNFCNTLDQLFVIRDGEFQAASQISKPGLGAKLARDFFYLKERVEHINNKVGQIQEAQEDPAVLYDTDLLSAGFQVWKFMNSIIEEKIFTEGEVKAYKGYEDDTIDNLYNNFLNTEVDYRFNFKKDPQMEDDGIGKVYSQQDIQNLIIDPVAYLMEESIYPALIEANKELPSAIKLEVNSTGKVKLAFYNTYSRVVEIPSEISKEIDKVRSEFEQICVPRILNMLKAKGNEYIDNLEGFLIYSIIMPKL